MIRLHLMRESVDKEKYIYDRAKAQLSAGGEVLVIVPNQYTLVAEKQALKNLEADCLFNVEIMSMNRLGLRLMTEQGLESIPMLSKYGRFMLLTKLIYEHRDELHFFSKSVGKISFTSMLNDFISDFKQQNCSVDEIDKMLEDEKTNGLLADKLKELLGILRDYEEAISERYTDSEDYIAKYIEAIKSSEYVKGKHIWIYGFDSITPKFTSAVAELACRADSLDMIVNESDYNLHNLLISQVEKAVSAVGATCEIVRQGRPEALETPETAGTPEGPETAGTPETPETAGTPETPENRQQAVDEFPLVERSETIRRIEKGLFNDNLSEEEKLSNSTFEPEGLTVVQCANQYYEAESAASYIHHLVRDKGYRYKDIVVIANDENVMQPIIKRVFAEYGLDVFLDSSRRITDSIGPSCIVNMLASVRYDFHTAGILAMLKTGLAGLDKDEIARLENYTRDYGIKHSMWKKDFKYYSDEEALKQINELRVRAVEPLLKLSDIIESSESVSNFVEKYREYLEKDWNLSEQIENFALEQEKDGLNEEAQRTRTSLAEALKLLDQMSEIMGDYSMKIEEFLDIYLAGLMDVEVGVIPPSLDGLTMGTMIRTRPREARAVVVLGANEGIMPLQPSSEGLFSVDEKAYFREQNFALGALDDIKMLEENLAMYRIMSHPKDELYISYAMADAQGQDMTASPIIDSLKNLFPMLNVRKDMISAGWGMDLVNDSYETLRHLVNHIKDRKTSPNGDSLTQALLHWYDENDKEELDTMLALLQDENRMPKLDKSLAKTIYARKDRGYVMSASGFDQYNACPFKFFVQKGLKAKEERAFRSDPRSIGDVYHECLQMVAEEMKRAKEEGNSLGAGNSQQSEALANAEAPANSEAPTNIEVPEAVEALENIEELVNKKLEEIARTYNEGLFLSAESEKYRLDRIKEICLSAAKALVEQLRSGSVTDIFLEEKFGEGEFFSPIELNVEGERILIEGRIDRADLLDKDKIRIVDYKTGNDKLDFYKMKQGYKMQLMIYLMSTMDKYEPAGLFYFNISDTETKLDGGKKAEEKLKNSKPEDSFKLKGAYIDEPGYLEMMPKEAIGGSLSGSKISKTEFMANKDAIANKLEELGADIVGGDISISPRKISNQSLACNNCDFKAICRYDASNNGNRSRVIKGKPRKQKTEE